jgi:hypothetical protein
MATLVQLMQNVQSSIPATSEVLSNPDRSVVTYT